MGEKKVKNGSGLVAADELALGLVGKEAAAGVDRVVEVLRLLGEVLLVGHFFLLVSLVGKLLHAAEFHLFALVVVLLALAGWGCGEADTDYGCAVKGAGDSLVEGGHVLRQESLGDSTKGENLFLVGVDNLGYPLCHSGLVLQSEAIVQRADGGAAVADCRKEDAMVGAKDIELAALGGAVEIEGIVDIRHREGDGVRERG